MGYSGSLYSYFANIPIKWWLSMILAGMVLALVVGKLYVAKKVKALQACSLIFLCEYMFIVLISTVLSRSPGKEYLYKLELFWSYRNFRKIGVIGVLFENVYNLFLLFPYGFLCKAIWKRVNMTWVMLSGLFISFSIEFLQLILKRGFFELDDIFHNTLGALLGYLVQKLLTRIVERRRENARN